MSERRGFKHKGRSEKAAPHVRLHLWMLNGVAWRSLSTTARALYVELKARYNGSNNGSIPFSVREAAEILHVGKSTANAAFRELVVHGFIEVSIRGSFTTRKDRHATEWRLTEHICDLTGDLPTKRFMQWEPGKDFTVRPQGLTVLQGGQGVPQPGLSRAFSAAHST